MGFLRCPGFPATASGPPAAPWRAGNGFRSGRSGNGRRALRANGLRRVAERQRRWGPATWPNQAVRSGPGEDRECGWNVAASVVLHPPTHEEVPFEHFDIDVCEGSALGDLFKAPATERRGGRGAAHELGGNEDLAFIDQPGIVQATKQARAAFDENVGHLAASQLVAQGRQADVVVSVAGKAEDCRPGFAQCRACCIRSRVQHCDEQGSLAGRLHEL